MKRPLSQLIQDPQLLHLIDPATGSVPQTRETLSSECIERAEHLCEALIGSTLVVRGKPFILANLELYYGGIGDMGHDWHRYNFQSKRGLSGDDIIKQVKAGPLIYISKWGNRQRMDIVVGNEGVAISVLVRNVLSPDLVSLSDKWTGNTKLIQDRMGITREDSGKMISLGNEFELFDTHHEFVDKASDIERSLRIQAGKAIGFNGVHGDQLWNFTLSEQKILRLKKRCA